MANQPPSLPTSALAGASAKANTDQIAVRIITLPDSARNAQPTKITGTVEGQNPDGTLKIKTDIGELRILLRDKGNLPNGLKIEIDIPAGNNPQQAIIRQQREPQKQDIPQRDWSNKESTTSASREQQQPTLARAVQQQEQQSTTRPAPPTSTPNITPETIQAQIKAQADSMPNILLKQTPATVANGALQIGQIVRLLPIPPNALPSKILNALLKPLSVPQLISNLVQMIETIPKGQTQLKNQLITLLSRLDFSTLSTPTPKLPAPPNTSQIPAAPISTGQATLSLTPTISASSTTPAQVLHAPLLLKIDELLKSIGLPSPFKNGIPQSPLTPPNPAPLTLFNPSKSIDGQILALPNPLTTLSTLTQPVDFKSGTIFQTAPVTPTQVLGFADDGLPILSVPLPQTGLTQLYTLQFKADNLSPGAPVFMALDPTTTKPTQAVFIQSPDGSLSLDQNLTKPNLNAWINSGTWDSLDDLLQNLTHISPQHAQSFRHILPNPAQPNTMGALSMFFLSVMRSGEADNWVGNEAISLLRQMGKAETVRAATSDITLSSRIENITLSQDWRMMMLPMLWENQIHKLPVYYKHMPDEKDAQDAADKKRRRLRFLFDLNLSRMGGVQVDGFMQSERLDIILRTKSPLSPPMQTQMKRIYAGAMEKSRLTGDLSFQFKPEQWVDLTQPQGNSNGKTGLHA